MTTTFDQSSSRAAIRPTGARPAAASTKSGSGRVRASTGRMPASCGIFLTSSGRSELSPRVT